MFRRLIAVMALSALVLAAQAGAQSEQPRQSYSDRFTTETPGAPTGRTYAIDYFDPANREGKPHAFSHLRVELAEGARFDTSAIPQCKASDAELMASGPSACPADTKVGTDETVVDTGFDGPARYSTADFSFFNNKDELILFVSVRENGARLVIRARVGRNTIDIDNPMIPGTPPDGGAAKSQRGTFYPRSTRRAGRQLNYITTPPSCPASGFWVNRVHYTYRDGVKQTAESRSPCRGSAADRRARGRRDVWAPRVRVRRVPTRRCTRRDFTARVRIGERGGLRRAVLYVDGKRVRVTRRRAFRRRIRASRMRPGRHRVTVVARDAAGNRGRRTKRFRRCRGR